MMTTSLLTNATNSNNEYNEDELWMEPPKFKPPGPFDAEKHARRTANHSANHAIGHPTIWKNYIHFGYDMYDKSTKFQNTATFGNFLLSPCITTLTSSEQFIG
jgi:hypothetical protein